MVQKLFLVVSILFSMNCFSQQEVSKNMYPVIVSISAAGEERTIKKVKDHIALTKPGFTWLGYCNQQKCLILQADRNSFPTGDHLLTYLSTFCGNQVMAIKDQPLNEFFKVCSFSDPVEYKYFKSTYGK